TPRVLPGLRSSIDWSRIDKHDNIVPLTPLNQALMDRESAFPSRFIRDPAAPGDPFGVGRIRQLDVTNINLARMQVEAWDVAIDYDLQTDRYGKFSLFSTATWIEHFRSKTMPTDAFVDSVGLGSSIAGVSTGSPLKLRASAGLTWTYRAVVL